MTQNQWDAAKAVLRGKFIVIQTYLKKQKKISNTPPYAQSNQRKKNKQNPKLVEGMKS